MPPEQSPAPSPPALELPQLGPVATYDALINELAAKAENAALRCKPTMWAYFGDMVDGLREWFADVTPSDGGFAGAALALSQLAEQKCPTLPRTEAARLWALGVYARRILAAWGTGKERVSLDWLRERSVGLFAEPAKRRLIVAVDAPARAAGGKGKA